MPLTSVLDNFTRADENPLSFGGRWTRVNSNAALAPMQVVSNACQGPSQNFCGSAWIVSAFTDFEVFVTAGTTQDNIRLFGRLRDVGGDNTYDGYQAFTDGTFVTIQRVDNATGTNILNQNISSPGAIQIGDIVSFRGLGRSLEMWLYRGARSFLLGGAADSTYPSGFIGVGSTRTADTFDDFGGGAIGPDNIRPLAGFGAC